MSSVWSPSSIKPYLLPITCDGSPLCLVLCLGKVMSMSAGQLSSEGQCTTALLLRPQEEKQEGQGQLEIQEGSLVQHTSQRCHAGFMGLHLSTKGTL